jgi:hypothetical protein
MPIVWVRCAERVVIINPLLEKQAAKAIDMPVTYQPELPAPYP